MLIRCPKCKKLSQTYDWHDAGEDLTKIFIPSEALSIRLNIYAPCPKCGQYSSLKEWRNGQR